MDVPQSITSDVTEQVGRRACTDDADIAAGKSTTTPAADSDWKPQREKGQQPRQCKTSPRVLLEPTDQGRSSADDATDGDKAVPAAPAERAASAPAAPAAPAKASAA